MRVKSIRLENYLGARVLGSFEPKGAHAVIVGPNNSGKSTILGSLGFLRTLLLENQRASPGRNPFLERMNGQPNGATVRVVHPSSDVATPDIFHMGAARAYCAVEFSLDVRELPAPEIFGSLPSTTSIINFLLMIEVQDRKKLLHRIDVNDSPFFIHYGKTDYFELIGAEDYKASAGAVNVLFYLLDLLGRVLYVPSERGISQDSQLRLLHELADGSGMIDWLRSAASADLMTSDGQRDHSLLQLIERRVASLLNAKTVRLSVSSQRAIVNLTIDGQPTPLSRLGTGVGSMLLLVVITTLTKAELVPIGTIAIEEPEIHLHPHLQRQFLDELLNSGAQLLIATHSPTVLKHMMESGARAFRTSKGEDHSIRVLPIDGDVEVLDALRAIGASPSDFLHAEKVVCGEGANDQALLAAWISKCPSLGRQSVSVLHLGGSNTTSTAFDVSQFRKLNPRLLIIMDSERTEESGEPGPGRLEFMERCRSLGIECHLTSRRSLDNYLSAKTLDQEYPLREGFAGGDYVIPSKCRQNLSKVNGIRVANRMSWDDLEGTDVADVIDRFLRS